MLGLPLVSFYSKQIDIICILRTMEGSVDVTTALGSVPVAHGQLERHPIDKLFTSATGAKKTFDSVVNFLLKLGVTCGVDIPGLNPELEIQNLLIKKAYTQLQQLHIYKRL